MAGWLVVAMLLGALIWATVRLARPGWEIDLDDLTDDWEQREAADPQRFGRKG